MKPKIVFVGAFQAGAKDGSVGGQIYACRTLLESQISNWIDWILLDSTMESLPPPSLGRRLFLSGKRLLAFVFHIRSSTVSGALIFSSARLSFVEKGLMVIFAQLFHKFVVLSPRSGLILDDLQESAFMRWFVPFVMRRCNLIMCQSQSWKQIYQSVTRLPQERFMVIYNWLDTKPYRQLCNPVLVDKDNTIRFLYLGWLEEYKGIFDLIEAVYQNQKSLKNARFIVCGQGSKREAAESLVVDYNLADKFEFRGWVTGTDKLTVLVGSDVFVLPSHREGMPNALLEAMSARLAVISTKVGAIPEIVVDGHSGLLCDAKDSDSLGKAMINLYYDHEKRKALGKHAQEYVLMHHDIEKVWPRVSQMFNALRGD